MINKTNENRLILGILKDPQRDLPLSFGERNIADEMKGSIIPISLFLDSFDEFGVTGSFNGVIFRLLSESIEIESKSCIALQ